MKTKKKLITGAIVLGIPAAVLATVTTFSNIEVGGSSTQPNNIFVSSIASGYANTSSYHSLVSGSYSYAHNSSGTIGAANEVKNLSAAVGYLNNVNRNAPAGGYPRASFAAGTWNYILGNDSIAAGWNNDLIAHQAAAFGYALVNNNNNSVVVGKYNTDKTGVNFSVGNGDSTTRSNAFEVHDNGDVIINKEQGDISMGGFGNTP